MNTPEKHQPSGGRALVWVVGVAAVAAIVVGQFSIVRRMSALERVLTPAIEEHQSDESHAHPVESAHASARTHSEEAPRVAAELPRAEHFQPEASDTSVASVLNKLDAGFTALQGELQKFTNLLPASAAVPAVPEYDPTQPRKPEEEEKEKKQNRPYGPEQATGAPNSTGGDDPKTWATQGADAGLEWLWVGFEKPVEAVQIRIRENYNPGGIIKVTGFNNQQEVVLWEGESAKASGVRDFVVNVPGGRWIQSVRVYLDTSRVPSWQEIDAVELVGRDGSRQWAASADASSWYGQSQQTDSLERL